MDATESKISKERQLFLSPSLRLFADFVIITKWAAAVACGFLLLRLSNLFRSARYSVMFKLLHLCAFSTCCCYYLVVWDVFFFQFLTVQYDSQIFIPQVVEVAFVACVRPKSNFLVWNVKACTVAHVLLTKRTSNNHAKQSLETHFHKVCCMHSTSQMFYEYSFLVRLLLFCYFALLKCT